jgi:uncharacterized protein with GYD domain
MTQKVFLRASRRAAEGIRRVYEKKGADVSVQLQTDGSFAVVVVLDDDKPARRGFVPWRTKSNRTSIAA